MAQEQELKGTQIGDDLYVREVRIADLREQDVNAQMMTPAKFIRLTENVRIRGALESLPYCHRPGDVGPISIISGHHRFRAAREAGMETIWVIVDTRPMTKSQIVAKQIAHNELHGEPDQGVLAEMVRMIEDVDSLLMSGLDPEKLPVPEPDDTDLGLPHADFDFRIVSLTFLPDQLGDVMAAVQAIDTASDVVGIGRIDQFAEFSRAMMDYGRVKNIRSMATVFAVLCEIAQREIAAAADLEG